MFFNTGAEYNESPLQRGDRTIWVSEEVQSAWSTPRRTLRDIWIETQIGRWMSAIGPRLQSRCFSRQITEIQVGRCKTRPDLRAESKL